MTSNQQGMLIKANAFERYLRARRLAVHNKRMGQPDRMKVNQEIAKRLAETYPDFPAAYEERQKEEWS